MKAKLILSVLLLSAIGLSATAQGTGAIVTKTFPVTADTWIYEGSNEKYGSKTTIEVQYEKSEKKEGDQVIETNYAKKVGLLSFDVEVPAGMRVDNACLYLVTERRKVNPTKIHLYGNDFIELEANWDSERQFITSALSSDAVQFTPAGESGKATFDGINDDNKNLTAWANIIDITSLISNLPDIQKVNLMIENGSETQNGDNRFYTKENEGIVKDKTVVDWASNISTQDLSPVLVITFVNKDAIVRACSDTWVGPGFNNKGSEGTIELKYNAEGSHHGLMAFEIPATPDGLKLNSANLVLTTERAQSIHDVFIYDYDADFDENLEWDNVREKISEVTKGDHFTSFQPKGQGGKAIFDGLDAKNQNLEAWKNEIDITDYVNSKINDATDPTRINLLFKKKEDSSNQICFYTKDTGNIRSNKANTDWVQKAHITPGQIQPYLILKYEPAEIVWTNNEVKIEEASANLTHKVNNKIKFNGGKNIDHSQVDLIVEKVNSASLSVYALADEETHVITKNSDFIEVEFKKAGNYTVTPVVAEGSVYAMPENASLAVSVNPIKVTVGTPDKNEEWSSEGEYTLSGLVEIEGEYAGDYDELFTLDVTPAWKDSEVVENAKTEFKPEWLYDQMVAILTAGEKVDGYLTADPKADLQNNTDLVVTTSCSGAYKVTFEGVDEDVVFVNNNNSTSQEVTINIAPSFNQQYSYSLNNKEYTNDGLNISGAQVDVDGKKAVLSQAEFDNAVLYVPGVYFVTIGYQVSPAAGTRDVAENQTIQNGGTMDLTDASALSLTMTKNGVTTEPLTITLTEGTPTAVDSIEAAEGEARYFNLQGVEVKNPDRGIFIKVQNGKASKVIM